MKDFNTKKQDLISFMENCNLLEYKHESVVFLTVLGNPHKFTERLSRIIEIGQLNILIDSIMSIMNPTLIELKKQIQSGKFNKTTFSQYEIINNFRNYLRTGQRHLNNEEMMVTNLDVHKILDFLFIIFGELSQNQKEEVIDKLVQQLDDEQIAILDINKPIEKAIYFPEENGAWSSIEKYLRSNMKIVKDSKIYRIDSPRHMARIEVDVKRRTRFVSIFYTLPYQWMTERDRKRSVLVFEDNWPNGAIIVEKL